jgi:Mg2+-importing ATPase
MCCERDGLAKGDCTKVDEIPYDFVRKRLTIVVETHGERKMITKGAFDNVLAICTHVAGRNGEQPLDDTARARLQTFYQTKGQAGFRVLGVATRKLDRNSGFTRDDERDAGFAGFLLFFDPPKPDAQKTIAELAQLGITVKVITGDNRFVAAHLAEAVGLDQSAMITGEDIAQLKSEALWQRAAAATLFVEVDPQQKELIIRALKKRGHAVG